MDFEHIVPRGGAQDLAFEELSCQLFHRDPEVPPGSVYRRLHGAGGDGGVEATWTLPDGREWGIQAKYVFDIGRVIAKTEESLRTALALHPRLTRFNVSIPWDLAGPTRRKGKSASEKFDDARERWIRSARAGGRNLEIVLETKSTLLGALSSRDPSGGLREYFFDHRVLGDDWFDRRLQAAIATAGPRYTAHLHVETPLADALEALTGSKTWRDAIQTRANAVGALVRRWSRAVGSDRDDGWGGAPFPPTLRPAGESLVALLGRVQRGLADMAESGVRGELPELVRLATRSARELHRELRAALLREHGPAAESATWKQYQAEYQVQFPAANRDAAAEVVEGLERLEEWLDSPAATVGGARALLLVGDAGVGKTHALCDLAERRRERGARTLVLFGEHFQQEPDLWTRLRERLDLPVTWSSRRVLSALGAAAEMSGEPLLLCVDGLNETRPRRYWRSELAAFVAEVRAEPWLRVCVSCRSTYADAVLPEDHGLVTVEHEGFAGVEFDACATFFAAHGLEPPVQPILQPHLRNPLFLKMLCEAMRASAQRRMPPGLRGLSTAMTVILRSMNAEIARELDRNERERLAEKGIDAFLDAAAESKAVSLPWNRAAEVVDVCVPGHTFSLLEWLVRRGLFAVDRDPASGDPDDEDLVRIAYERVGEYLLARRLLVGIPPGQLRAEMNAGRLAFALGSDEGLDEHEGIVEALTALLPEADDGAAELVDLAPADRDRYRLLEITVRGLPWRDPARFTERTRVLVLEALSGDELAVATLDAVLVSPPARRLSPAAAPGVAPSARAKRGIRRTATLRAAIGATWFPARVRSRNRWSRGVGSGRGGRQDGRLRRAGGRSVGLGASPGAMAVDGGGWGPTPPGDRGGEMRFQPGGIHGSPRPRRGPA